MKSDEIRDAFLNYFKSNGHNIVRSAPLVPKNDPSLLFVNAGMVQFKDVFLGKEKREYNRATSCQKCVRAGGKHNDLENVGYTARHHTFFEMLGNFSFGDYFKKDAIHFGWEFITKTLGIDKSKLWITVFRDDDEAFDIWNKQEGVSSSRIVRMGEKDNFWSMGDTGPCGPCSEIHIDQGPGIGCGRPECSIECDCDRYLELWNLVFMQFEKDKNGVMTKLPKPSIDTGLGLERVAAIMQGVHSNFDTDVFKDIIEDVSQYFALDYGKNELNDVAIRVIADHIRATDFLISDGVIPDKEGRGYVLRRIMRRAMRFGKKLGANEAFLYKFIDSVNTKMGGIYPELIQNREMVVNIVKSEEKQFSETLDDGLKVLNEIFKKSSDKFVKGEDAFKLYDTYGFPVDLTCDIAKENGFEVDMESFNAMLNNQREKSKASWKGTGEISTSKELGDVYKNVGMTEFTGYDKFEINAVLKAIVDKNGNSMTLAEEGECYFIFDRTPFYAQSGGQVSDTGFIFNGNAKAFVEDVQKYFNGNLFVHKVSIIESKFEIGKEYTLKINRAKRKDIARHHSATHLLDAALIKVLGGHIRQAGSMVEDNRLRFDFTHYAKLSDGELKRIELIVNGWIVENYEVKTEVMDIDKAMENGAIALFEEKYSDKVRVVSMGDVSKELCGGTHVKSIGEIGLFKIISESALSKGVRRIEAKVGINAYEYIRKNEDVIKNVAKKLNVSIGEIPAKIDDLISKKKIKKDAVQLEFNRNNVKTVKGVKVYIERTKDLSVSDMRNFGDNIKANLKSGIVIIINESNSKVNVIAMVTEDCVKEIKARDVVAKISKKLLGKGGGKDTFAQGGGKNAEPIDYIIKNIEEFM